MEGSGKTMEICKDCIHEEICLFRAFEIMQKEKTFSLINECDRFKSKETEVDIYKMADRITETVKQVVLANLRSICDEEGD